MLEHAKRHHYKTPHEHIHRVDRILYGDFVKAMGWSNPPAFPPCVPTLGNRREVRDAREKIRDRREEREGRERMAIKGLRLKPPRKKDAPRKASRVEETLK